MVIASENPREETDRGEPLPDGHLPVFHLDGLYRGRLGTDRPSRGSSGEVMVASPLPQVIVLTAIVVGIALTAVGLALIIRIYAEYGTLREDTLREVRADE